MQSADVDKVLAAIQLSMCPLDSCPAWFIKSIREGLPGWVQSVVNTLLHNRGDDCWFESGSGVTTPKDTSPGLVGLE